MHKIDICSYIQLDDDGVFDHDAFIDIVIDPMKDMANKMKAHCKDKIKNGMVFQPWRILLAT